MSFRASAVEQRFHLEGKCYVHVVSFKILMVCIRPDAQLRHFMDAVLFDFSITWS